MKSFCKAVKTHTNTSRLEMIGNSNNNNHNNHKKTQHEITIRDYSIFNLIEGHRKSLVQCKDW